MEACSREPWNDDCYEVGGRREILGSTQKLPQRDELTMLEFQSRQREVLVETLRELANIAVGALGFGQVLSDRPLSPVLALVGTGVWLGLLVGAMVFAREHPR